MVLPLGFYAKKVLLNEAQDDLKFKIINGK